MVGPLVIAGAARYAGRKLSKAKLTKKKKIVASKAKPVQGPQPSKRIVRKNKRKAWVGKIKSKLEEGASRRRVKRLARKGKVSSSNVSKARKNQPVKAKTYSRRGMKAQEKVSPGMGKTGKVSRGAVGAVKTKGGTYAKYKKDSKEAGNFRSKFKSACGGGAKSFSWQGRSYACKTKASPKKASPKKGIRMPNRVRKLPQK